MKQKIFFTALPNGINPVNNAQKISVAINLQVIETPNDTLLDSVTDMLNWAQLINAASFIVEKKGVVINATRTSPAADTGLWNEIFRPNVKVNAFEQQDMTKTPILSYPVKHIVDYIEKLTQYTGSQFSDDMPAGGHYTENPLYTDISNYTVLQFPTSRRIQPTLNTLAPSANKGRRVKGHLEKNTFFSHNPSPDPKTDFAQLCHFHGMYDVKPVQDIGIMKEPDFEFHDIVSILTQYPQLMRRLGLVVDLELSGRMMAAPVGAQNTIRVFPSGISFNTTTTIVSPATLYDETPVGFYARPSAGSIINKGHVKINTPDFTVFQIDTDGTAIKFTSHIDALQLKKAKHFLHAFNSDILHEGDIPIYNNEQEPRREGLPSQRTAGIALARNGMAAHLHNRFVRMEELKAALALSNQSAPPSVINQNANYILGNTHLTADDVNMGFRMDIRLDDPATTGQWLSLHFNQNEFIIPGTSQPILNGIEEGFMQLSTTEDKNIEGPHIKISEVIGRWEGWSLSVPMPGRGLNEPTLTPGKEVEETDADEAMKFKNNNVPFKLNVIPKVAKGTLPKLRFGQDYSIKVRSVDLAGNSVPHNTAPENTAEAIRTNIRYLRYEPVDVPQLLPGTTIKDGESTEVMAIRSNGETVAKYEQEAMHPGHDIPFRDVSIRHAKPPRSTMGMSITHSMLDHAMGEGKPATGAAYERITSEKDPFVESTYNPENKYEKGLQAPVTDGDQKLLNVEYLVDPMAAGVVVFMSKVDPNKLPANQAEKYSTRCSFYFDDDVTDANINTPADFEEWMKPKTFRIILKEDKEPSVKWIKENRTLEVRMQPGFMIKLNYCSYWRPSDIQKLSGMFRTLNQNNFLSSLGKNIGAGRHWMFSPWRTLTLVHAVQQPIAETDGIVYPRIQAAASTRKIGDNFAGLAIEMQVHGPSTGVIDVEGIWEDWIDNPNTPSDPADVRVRQVIKKAKVYHFTPSYHVFQYEFGNFPNKPVNTFIELPHVFNDTRHRWVDYHVKASTRYKEYFHSLIRARQQQNNPLDITRSSNVVKVNVLSSARPAAPQIAYVIPTFEWAKHTSGNNIMKTRVSGLRVYLKRPWYTSGEGEKLAVVLAIVPVANIKRIDTRFHERHCTTWGNDPTKYAAGSENIFPAQTDFEGVKAGNENSLYAETGLAHPASADQKVNIVAYAVQFDEERQLYYADIMLKPGTKYFPFVRLALAAYQQHAVRTKETDVCLSEVVLADYTQIPAPRMTTVKIDGNKITVSISGPIPATIRPNMYKQRVDMNVEPADLPSTEDVILNINTKMISNFSQVILPQHIANNKFTINKEFIIPADIAKNPYRIKILEFEMIMADPRRATIIGRVPITNDRLVFADVYEMNV